jgi:hypothetical protein
MTLTFFVFFKKVKVYFPNFRPYLSFLVVGQVLTIHGSIWYCFVNASVLEYKINIMFLKTEFFID